jgi:LexA DNA binding domain
MSDQEIESNLKGNTLRVYWYLLGKTDNSTGVREIQRALKFSSPALAAYHLDKLADMGLIEKANSEYRIVKTVNVGVLKQFVKFGTFMIPRFLLYATMFTTLLAFYLTQFKAINFYSVFALVLGLLSTGIMWFETLMTWRQKP